jgi:hypothetical protein
LYIGSVVRQDLPVRLGPEPWPVQFNFILFYLALINQRVMEQGEIIFEKFTKIGATKIRHPFSSCPTFFLSRVYK